MKSIRDQQVRREQFNTFAKLHRPFTIGVLQQKHFETSHHWEHIGTNQAVNHMLNLQEAREVSYYASWPLQAYISGFGVSNSISVSYTQECERLQPSEWVTATTSSDSSEGVSQKVSEDVLFQINGGAVSSTVLYFSGSPKRIHTEEVWADEQP